MSPLQATLLNQFRGHFGASATHWAQAPGRVNLIGEHTDYNEGFVLPCAIDFSTVVALRARDDTLVNVMAVNFQGATDSFDLEASFGHNLHQPWANYVRGVLRTMQEAGWRLRGMDMAIVGDIPQGTGLSSSASLEVAVIAGVCSMHGIDVEPGQWAKWAQLAENRFVGTQCGIMDMWISATAKAECASLLDCRSLTSTHCHVPEALQLLIINSRVERGLVGSEYNLRRQQCERAAQHMGQRSLRDVPLADLLSAEAAMDVLAFKRARHVLTENARTLHMAEALNRNDVTAISRWMAESHASMRDDFEITVPAIDNIVAIVSEIVGHSGGVRMTGGGFGGCVVALVPHALVESCRDALAQRYRSPQGVPANVFLPRIGSGASSHLVA